MEARFWGTVRQECVNQAQRQVLQSGGQTNISMGQRGGQTNIVVWDRMLTIQEHPP